MGTSVKNFCSGEFWDLNQTWNNQVPVFSSCFEDIIFTSVPCLLYSLIILVSLFCLPRPTTHNPLPWTWLNGTKLTLCICLWGLSIVWCGAVIHQKNTSGLVPSSTLMAACTRVLCFSFVGIATWQHRVCRVRSSTVLSTLWLFFSFFGIVLYRSDILTYFTLKSQPASGIIFVINMVFYPIIFVQLFLSIFVDRKKFNILQENVRIKDEVSFLTHITFLWFMKLILKGRKKLLKISDLSFLSVRLTASWIYDTFSKRWKYYLMPQQTKNPSLGWTLIKSFWPYVSMIVILDLMFVVSLMLPPLILDRIIDFTSDDFFSWRGYLFAGLIFVVDCFGKIVNNNILYYEGATSVQFQVALMGCLFRKNLHVSTSARKDFPSGNLMNLLSVDVKRIQWFTIQAATLISAPLKIVLIIFIMWQYLGPATLAGVGVMVLMFPISYYISRVGEKYSEKQMTTKDIRSKHMNEILNGIKILKLYAWEKPFGSKVSEARKEEIKWIRYTLLCYLITTFVYFCAPFMVSLASFATYLFIDKRNVLDPTRAFVSLTLMEQLRYALFELPDSISELIQCNVSLGRLRNFFTAENKDESMTGNNPEKGEVLTIKEASFSWSTDDACALTNINLNVRKGKLIAVIGPVGSGKSSLISAILGEMCKKSGSIDLKGSIAYVPQQPWVLNRTLKRNILLERHMNEDKYNKIVELCCLKPDLDILPAGDETEIGEKGVNLSGGQKLRVNLAQAVYQDKEMYLLDDPLSAVDVHVRKSLFNDVIGNTGLLRNKTRILVTHDVSVLHNVDLIVSMKDGQIDEIGSYKDLLTHKGSFFNFVEEHSNAKMVEEQQPKYHRALSRLISTNSTTSKRSQEEDREEIHFKEAELSVEDTKGLTHRLTDDERMEVGGVHRLIYFNYVKQIGVVLFACAVFWYAVFIGFEAAGNVWLSKWSADATANGTGANGTHGTSETIYRLSIYGTLGCAQVFCIVVGSLLLMYGTTRASELYHKGMLNSVLKSPMSFFDSTPTGRIINRFTTDLDTLDILIFYRIDGWINCLFNVIASFIIIGINTPIFLASLIPLAVVYYIIQKLHLTTFRQIKRLESTARSPIYSLFMESIQGVSSILAYGVQKEFILNFEKKLDDCFVCFYNSWVCNRWFNFFLDLLGSFIILFATSLAILNRDSLNPAVVGLIISYSLSVTDAMKWFVRLSSELEDKSISIERVEEYCHLKPEASWDLSCEGLEDNWPQNGNIEFDGYSTKYREDLDLVLKEIRLSVKASEKVGVIGRTGAGKSSITLALFRIIEPVSGTILIDNIDITKIGLHNLRANLTIIPQDPVLFTGSLRMNLDPSEAYSDDEIWASLEKSYLKPFVSTLNEGLSYELEEGGSNLSAGQRQLVCLARALLKNSKILVLDEATASVDMDTDNLIQKTIRTAFADNTVITIAHRIHTVLDYDKIVVMESGQIAEVGNPKELLKDSNSKFHEMNKEAGLL